MRGKKEGGSFHFSLPTSSLLPLLLSSFLSFSEFDCSQITASLLSPRVLAGGNMNCVLGNMSNRYTRYVYNHVYSCIGLHACVNVCVCVWFCILWQEGGIAKTTLFLGFWEEEKHKEWFANAGKKKQSKTYVFHSILQSTLALIVHQWKFFPSVMWPTCMWVGTYVMWRVFQDSAKFASGKSIT